MLIDKRRGGVIESQMCAGSISPILSGLRTLPPQSLRAAFFCLSCLWLVNRSSEPPAHKTKNRCGTDPDRSACYAGPGAFTRRDDAPFSPPRPNWCLGCGRNFSPIQYQEGKRKSESCRVEMN